MITGQGHDKDGQEGHCDHRTGPWTFSWTTAICCQSTQHLYQCRPASVITLMMMMVVIRTMVAGLGRGYTDDDDDGCYEDNGSWGG